MWFYTIFVIIYVPRSFRTGQLAQLSLLVLRYAFTIPTRSLLFIIYSIDVLSIQFSASHSLSTTHHEHRLQDYYPSLASNLAAYIVRVRY